MMFCPNCGTQLPDGSAFCPNCGTRLGGMPQGGTQNAYAPEYAAVPRRSGLPIILLIGLVILLALTGVIAFFVRQSVLENSPLHGAKLKKQVVWQTEDLSVSVTGLRYDDSDDDYPYVIDLAVKNASGTNCDLRCEGAAINGIQTDTRLDLVIPAGGSAKGELRLSEREVKLRVGLQQFSTIDLAFGAGSAHSDVVHLKTGLKMPEAHLSIGEDDPLYNAGGVRVNHTTFYPVWPALELYVENNTGRSLAVRQGDVLVSGGAARTEPLEDIFLPGTCGYIHLIFSVDELESDGLLPIKSIDTTLYLSDPATGETVAEIPVHLDKIS